MGGGFGSKLGLNEHTVVAGRPGPPGGPAGQDRCCRGATTPLCVGYRPSSHQTYKVGAKKDGTLTAFSLDELRVRRHRPRATRSPEPVVDLYRCPNCKVEEYTVFTNVGGSRAMRAPGHTQGAFGLERLDGRAGRGPGHGPARAPQEELLDEEPGRHGPPLFEQGPRQVLRARARRPSAGSGATRSRARGRRHGPLRRGLGMATSIWFGAGVPGTLADIVLYPDMSVEVVCGTQDIGTGTRTHMAVVAAETLGLEPKDITVKLGNSDYPWAPISGGSLTTPSVAPAVRDAALKAVERLKDARGGREAQGRARATSSWADRKFSSKSDSAEKRPSFAEVYRDLRRESVFHGERGGMPDDTFAFNTFGAHFAEVEVDIETGKVRVLKYVAAQDSGQIINRQTAESQVIGGITQGLSAGLFEERVMDADDGDRRQSQPPRLQGRDLARHPGDHARLRRHRRRPRINNLGVKGLGEPARDPGLGGHRQRRLQRHRRPCPARSR